jgi:DNA-binding response OmpR family regulator
MVKQLTTSREQTPNAQQSEGTELWVLVITQQGRPNHSLVRLLQEWMRVDVARDLVVSHALAFEGMFDAIILDRPIGGPECSIALCRELRHVGVMTPIVVLAERASVDDIVTTIEAGADDVLAQSVGGGVLVARLRALQRHAGALPPMYQPGVHLTKSLLQ